METDDFFIYRHTYTNTDQIVTKNGKKFLVIDDINDAQQMSKDGDVILAPKEPPKADDAT